MNKTTVYLNKIKFKKKYLNEVWKKFYKAYVESLLRTYYLLLLGRYWYISIQVLKPSLPPSPSPPRNFIGLSLAHIFRWHEDIKGEEILF